MTIQHASIVDPNIHEPKGVVGATQNTVYVADGSGSGVWTPINYPLKLDSVLSGRSYTTQGPTAVDVTHQVTFGAEQTTTEASLSSAGAITINVTGAYDVAFVFRLNRTTGAGTALIGLRWLLNGSTIGGPTGILLADGSFTIPFSFTRLAYFNAGDIITAEIIRDSSGVNDGSLAPASFVSTDWPDAAGATVIINKPRAEL